MNSKLFPLTMMLSASLAMPAIAENPAHIQQLLSTKQCAGCDLTGAGLVFARLPGANLAGANLAGANLAQVNLAGADLRGANLAGATLHSADLTGAKLTGADLTGADLRNAMLAGSEVSQAKFDAALLQGAIGLATQAGTAENFYAWALEAAHKKQFGRAIENFNQTLVRKPDFAAAYLGRAMSRIQVGDQGGGITDAEQAIALFEHQGDQTNAKATRELVTALKNPPKDRGPSFGESLLNTAVGLLQFFLFR
jgi:uncharacterized protein YjbI with pentapeptide repeats